MLARAACFGFLLFLGSANAIAGIINGDFSTGDFSGWNYGVPGPMPSNFLGSASNAVVDGKAVLKTQTFTSGTFNGSPTASFNPIITQKFDATAGSRLRLDLTWNLTSIPLDGTTGVPLFQPYHLDGGIASTTVRLTRSWPASTFDDIRIYSSAGSAPIGSEQLSFLIPSDGQYTLTIIAKAAVGESKYIRIGLITYGSSAAEVTVDNVALVVPEPSTVGLGLMGLTAVAAMLRYRGPLNSLRRSHQPKMRSRRALL